jgi:hypothetical protein
MAKKTYTLYNSVDILDQRLAVEIGRSYIVLVAGSSNLVAGLEFYEMEESDLQEVLDDIKQQSQLLSKTYSETNVYYNLHEVVLVPVGQFNTSIASELLDVAFGNNAIARVNVENINVSPGIVNVYRSNEHWQDIISNYFRAITKRHIYSKLVEEAIEANNNLTVQFYRSEMIVVAAKNKQLKIVRSFSFSNDADVLYHLLNVCKQVDMDATETTLSISGLINTDSNIFLQLQKYFAQLKLNNASEELLPADQLKQYPLHYFTPFFKLLS